jgi:DinB superfamily
LKKAFIFLKTLYMKKALLLFSMISLFSYKTYDKTLTQSERDYAVQFMIQTRDALLNDVNGLNPAQINFKADSTRWSVAQCVEHIAVAEGTLMMFVQMSLKSPADPSKRDSIKYTDQQIVNGVQDRTRKFQAPEMLRPDGKFVSYQAALDSFLVRRNRNIEYVKTTQDDLRDHFFQHPVMGTMDDYQGILLMVGHSKRHTLQLEEVKANPGYPKN